uniref:Uncharacterized protein n=1 Tax=Anguilla anguilla TaxID=7936 RepID=A0A0E9V4P5_ANGAN
MNFILNVKRTCSIPGTRRNMRFILYCLLIVHCSPN